MCKSDASMLSMVCVDCTCACSKKPFPVFLMQVPMSLSHKDFTILLLGMHSPNHHQINDAKWGIFNASVLLKEHGQPLLLQN